MTRRRLPRNTAAVLGAAILEVGEVAYDITNMELRYGDGVTLGGRVLQAHIFPAQRTVASGRGSWQSRAGELSVYSGDRTGASVIAGTGGLYNAKGLTFTGSNALADGTGFNTDFASGYGNQVMRYARSPGGYCGNFSGLRGGHIWQTVSYAGGFGCDIFILATHLDDSYGFGVKPGLNRSSIIGSLIGGSSAGQGGGAILNCTIWGGGSCDNFGSAAVNDIANQLVIGRYTMRGVTTAAQRNLAIGDFAGTGNFNAIGGSYSTIVGHGTAPSWTSGIGGTHVGDGAGGGWSTSSYQCTFGLNASAANYTNSFAAGALALCTADNQFRFAPGVTPTSDNAMSVTSDFHDKADIQANELGLDFLDELRIVSYVRDFRSAYFEYVPETEESLEEQVQYLPMRKSDIMQAAAELVFYTANYTDSGIAWNKISRAGALVKVATQPIYQRHTADVMVTRERLVKTPVSRDGRHKGKRRHLGVIAQEVDAICKRLGIDFAALQHHLVSGGEDVWSFVYEQLILVNSTAIQELHQKHKTQTAALAARLDALEGRKAAA